MATQVVPVKYEQNMTDRLRESAKPHRVLPGPLMSPESATPGGLDHEDIA